MSFSLLSELHDMRISKPVWKREALEFQRLMLENPWLENLDVELEHIDNEDGENILVHVKHPEFMDLTFNVAEGFLIVTPENSERYGDTGEEAYKRAMPILIGMKAGFDLKEKVDDFTIQVSDGLITNTCILTFEVTSHGDRRQDVRLRWNVAEQGFEPDDPDNLPSGHGMMFKTIKEVEDYLRTYER